MDFAERSGLTISHEQVQEIYAVLDRSPVHGDMREFFKWCGESAIVGILD